MSDSYDEIEITSRSQWRRWLGANGASTPGIWVITHKKSEGEKYVPYGDVRDEALCHGWIDGRAGSVDERRTKLLVTPRKPKSGWSRVNKQRLEALEAEGRMTDAGRAAIEVAKENGSWSALDDVENLIEPPELKTALDAEPDARHHWDEFPRSAKRAILEWIYSAKRPETKEKRVGETARLAAENIRANQPRQPQAKKPR